MISEIDLVEREIGPVVEIEEKVSMMKMAPTLGKDYSMLYDYLKENNVETKESMPYTHYIDVDWDEETHKSGFRTMIDVFTKKWHFFAGVPTGKQLPDHERIVSDEYTTTHCIHCIHTGPYKEMGETYKVMVQWAHDHNVRIRNEAFEFYLNDPGEVQQVELKTELFIPVV